MVQVMRLVLLAVLCLLLGVSGALAHGDEAPGATVMNGSPELSRLIPNLYGPNGLVVDSNADLPGGGTHSAHFNSAFQSSFTQFNVAFASELSALPLPSPASGFTYEFDPTTGTFTRSTTSFGPILAERAETIGKGRWSFGATVQHFSFDELDGVDLDSIEAVFTHDSAELGGGRADIVTTDTSIDADITQLATFLTYGLTPRVDVSIALPFLDADLDVFSDAHVERIGTVNLNPDCDPPTPECLAVHYFENEDGTVGDQRNYHARGSSKGIGDLIVRFKGNALKKERVGVALGMDIRLPTGDEEELLGTGAWGLKPFVAVSFPHRVASPHFNVGYQWNDDSVLAGDVATGFEGELPDQLFYSAGVDIGINERLTLAFDLIGQRTFDASRLITTEFKAADGQLFSDIDFEDDDFSTHRAAIGIKTKVKEVLLNFNLLFHVEGDGLVDDVTPLVGVEYSF